jgi:hypothetical protein
MAAGDMPPALLEFLRSGTSSGTADPALQRAAKLGLHRP